MYRPLTNEFTPTEVIRRSQDRGVGETFLPQPGDDWHYVRHVNNKPDVVA